MGERAKQYKKLYVVTMMRFTGFHCYILGIYYLKHQAITAATTEEKAIGDTKYYATVWEIISGQNAKAIYGTANLTNNPEFQFWARKAGFRY